MKDALSKPYIQNPARWDVYERPADNLLFAILMRAVNDSLGFYDANHGKYDNGNSAIEWLHTEGKRIYKHLLTAPENPKDNRYEINNMEKRQLSYEEIEKIYVERICNYDNNK